MKEYNLPDLDLDTSMSAKEKIESSFERIPASKLGNNGFTQHLVGSYFCDIPKDELTGLSSIDYKIAENDFGYQKIDILHNTSLDSFSTRTEMIEVLDKPIMWDMLKNKEVVEQLPHINNYYSLICKLPKIDSILKLAYFLAIIRPGKKHLIESVVKNGWESIVDEIWVKSNDGYQFKKSHSIAYSMAITVAMRTLNG